MERDDTRQGVAGGWEEETAGGHSFAVNKKPSFVGFKAKQASAWPTTFATKAGRIASRARVVLNHLEWKKARNDGTTSSMQ